MRNKALLDAILEAAVDAIIVADATGTILRANTAACHLFQYTADEIAGENVSILMPAEMARHHSGFMEHHMKTGERRIIGIGRETEGQRSDGTVFPLHLSVGRTDVDAETLFVGVLHDLSLRAAAQQALARSQRLDALGKLTGGIAHDFNNILTVVIGNLELLDARGLSARQEPLVRDALTSAELGADLTDRLKVFARRGNLRPVKADLGELCADTLAILKRTLGSNFSIETDFPDDLAPVMIDPVQLQSALMNLMINARDAMGERGTVLVSAANVTVDDTYMAQEIDMEPGDYVRLSVSDDGAGMTPEAQKRAFEPFFTTKTVQGGTGMGLATVYGFVRQSGGHITIYSELGLGTSFGLYFPMTTNQANDGDAHPGSPSGTQPSEKVPMPRGKGEIIFVVEDNPRVRKLSIERLEALGYRTEVAESGDEAWRRILEGLKIDALFSDLVMPGRLNGYQLAAKVHAAYPQIPILLTSGYASDVVSNAMADDTPHDILHKPYRHADLADRLHALFPELSDDETT